MDPKAGRSVSREVRVGLGGGGGDRAFLFGTRAAPRVRQAASG